MKIVKLRNLVQQKMDKKTPGSSDVMHSHVESLIEIIAPMIREKIMSGKENDNAVLQKTD